jgi:hypothetical protein
MGTIIAQVGRGDFYILCRIHSDLPQKLFLYSPHFWFFQISRQVPFRISITTTKPISPFFAKATEIGIRFRAKIKIIQRRNGV